MDDTTRKALREDLTRLSTEIAVEMRAEVRVEGPAREMALRLHADERVGDAFDVWTDLLARRGAVLWVLKSVYVRVLEDRRLLAPGRILDQESQSLFEHIARDLGPTAYLRWVYRDLASPRGGLPELFARQPAEIALDAKVVRVRPDEIRKRLDVLSQKLLDLWRKRDTETGQLVYRFDEEHFDGRLMGDLYQDLDPVVKKRYALLQTPDFILDFILDETLTPAIAEWGVETVRVLDPACGSGHFLLAAFKRLVAGMREKFPEKPVWEVVLDVLKRVVGIDLNDYACALARTRLVMTALESCGETELGAGAAFHPQVYWADALEQVERDEEGQIEMFRNGRPKALLTRPEVRKALRPILKAGFHAVVGNPPYITEKDANKRDYHKEKVGKGRRYVSATGIYSLGCPFTERMLQLAVPGGFMGEITADSFMKREFGKALIQVLAQRDLRKVVSMSGAYIPGHGTSTVMLFARNRLPHDGVVRVVMGKRGEPGKPADPAQGRVWLSILEGHSNLGFESEFVTIADVERATLTRHPWSIGGGGAAELKGLIEKCCVHAFGHLAEDMGFGAITKDDELFSLAAGSFVRWGIAPEAVVRECSGELTRNWGAMVGGDMVFPYHCDGVLPESKLGRYRDVFWQQRTLSWTRAGKGFKTLRELGYEHYQYGMFYWERHYAPLKMAFAFKATHNHFILDRGGKVFNRTAPVIKLPADATEEQHLVLLAQLNSSTGEFWVKQTMQSMGAQGIGRGIATEAWEHFFERDAGKLESFPLISTSDAQLETFARHLDTLARERVADSPRATLDTHAPSGAPALRAALDVRRDRDLTRLYQMVGLQEELDWLCYHLYGLDPDAGADVRLPEHVPPLRPGLRPFEITLAQEDAERRAALARGEEPDEQPTAWFTRHGWEPVIDLTSTSSPSTSTSSLTISPSVALIEARLARTAASRDLSLIEQPTYKRRWYRPDHETEEREAMELWLADRLEAWAKERREPFTVRQAAAALQADPAVLAVGELLAGRADFDLDALAADRIRLESVPGNKHHVFKPEGLLKRAAWEKTWEMQHLEDAGKLPLGEDGKPVPIPVPPKYERGDYLKAEHWTLRGKLDVPKERFIAFTEVPPDPSGVSEEPLFGWAGWTHRERARALLALDEKAESAGVKVPDRYGLLYGVWFLLPYVAWESPQAASDFRADVKSLVGEQGVTEEVLAEWAGRFPVGKPRAGRGRRAHTEPAAVMGTRRSTPRSGARQARSMLGATLAEHAHTTGIESNAHAPGPRPMPARQRDPRWLAVVLEEMQRLGPAGADALGSAVRARAALDPGLKPSGSGDRGAELRQVGNLQRELQHLGWIELLEDRWVLTAPGEALARGRPTETPFAFARELCVVGERAYDGVVSRLLARLWELNPERQGAVVLPAPAIGEPPDRAELLDPWLRTVLGAQRDLLKSLTPGLTVPEGASEPPAREESEGKWSTWDKLAPHRRRSRAREMVDDRTLGWLFGAIASPDEVKVWQTRMDWAGLSLLARHLPGVRGQVWFPVGAFRREIAPDFVAVEGIEREGRTYYPHAPSGPAAETGFAASLFQAYEARSRADHAEYVSLAAIRDAVAYDLRISHESFQSLLQAIVPRVLRGELPYQLSAEVDITPEERARLGSSLTVVVDHIPRHIIAMRRFAPSKGDRR